MVPEGGRRSLRFPAYPGRVAAALRCWGTQAEFCRQTGLPPGQVSRWARGLPGDFDALKRFAEALGVPWAWLVADDTELRAAASYEARARETIPLDAEGAAPEPRRRGVGGRG